MEKLKKILFVSDVHSPYEDKRAWKLLLKVGRYLKVWAIVVVGDFADFYSVSSHSKNPSRLLSLKKELEEVGDRLNELGELGAKEKYFLAGNHEDRLRRYLEDQAPELYGYFDLESIFGLKTRGWKYTPYKDFLKLGKLYVTHDTGKCGKYTHYQASEMDFQANTVIGHTHRMGYCVTGNAKGKHHEGNL